MRLQESIKVFPLCGSEIHKSKANVKLIPALALNFVIPEHLSPDFPLALSSRKGKAKNEGCLTAWIVVKQQVVALN
jgi:hypothetical protein